MSEFLTKENMAALEAELAELMGPKRKEIVAAIEYAKSLGDLSENAEYHSARENQGKLEERIAQIDYILKNAEIIKHTNTGFVAIGSTVVVQKENEPNTRTFQIVGTEETDMLSGKISYKSPLGAALLKKAPGDMAIVQTPRGEMSYKIVSVK